MSDAIAREVAEAEFARFGAVFDLDLDVTQMDAEDREKFDEARGVFIRAMQRGALVVESDGSLTYAPRSGGDKVKIKEPIGQDFMGGFSRAEGNIAKTCAILASMNGRDAKTFSALSIRDINVLDTLTSFFLRA